MKKEDYSPREREIMLLATDGQTDKQIAEALGISAATVSSYWARVREKSGAVSRTQALMRVLGEELRETAREAKQALEDRDVLIEQAEDYAVFGVDPGGTILDWNGGVLRVLGYAEDEFVGQRLSLVFTPEDAKGGEPEHEIEQASERGRYADKRWHQRKDGTQVWIDGYLVAHRDEHTGQVRKFSKIMRDDTERKGLEEEVQRLHGRISKGGFAPTE